MAGRLPPLQRFNCLRELHNLPSIYIEQSGIGLYKKALLQNCYSSGDLVLIF